MKVFRGIHLVIGIGITALLFACNGDGTTGLTVSEDALEEGGISTPVTDPRFIPEPATGNEEGTGTGSETGGGTVDNTTPATVKFLLTDAPNPAIDSAVVTLSGVTVHGTGGGHFSVMDESRTLDLLDLQNGVTTLLGEISLEPDKYTQIRMNVESGEVMSEGTAYAVDIPSGDIKINRNIEVCGGGDIEIVIDFDAEASLRYNKGRDLFTMRPVIKVESITSTCPDEPVETEPTPDDDEDEETVEDEDATYDGTLGWLSIVLPPVTPETFSSLTALINDIQVHDQGIGQVKTFTEDYFVDLLETARLVNDPETGEPLYTILIPPVQVPAGDLDQIRLLFAPIIAVTADTGSTVIIQLPEDCDGEGDGECQDDPEDGEVDADDGEPEEAEITAMADEEDPVDPLPDEDDGTTEDDPVDETPEDIDDDEAGLKFFGSIEVCENGLTILMWNLDLSVESLPFAEGEDATVMELHPVIHDPELLSVCEPYEAPGTDDGGDEDSGEEEPEEEPEPEDEPEPEPEPEEEPEEEEPEEEV